MGKAKQQAATAQAFNLRTATQQAGLNSPTVIDENGNTVTTRIDPTKKPGDPGYFIKTTTLSPENKALQQQQQAQSKAYGDIASKQLGAVSETLGTPFQFQDYDPNAAKENKLYNLQKQYLDEEFTRQGEGTDQWLADRGINIGSPAYAEKQRQLATQQAAQRTGLIAATDQQMFNQAQQGQQFLDTRATAQRALPFQELATLRGGAAPTPVNFQMGPQTGVANVDYLGQKQAQDAAATAKNNAMLGAIGSTAGTLGSAFIMSDRRLKTDIKKVGDLDDGTNVYSYRMKGSPFMQMGVMAQEVEKKHPGAVKKNRQGYRAVNYSKIVEAL